MKNIKNMFLMITVLCISITFAGCTSAKEEINKSKEDGKTLTFSWAKDIGDLNPHMYGINQMFAQAMVYEPLVRYGENGKVEGALAESWDISEDGKEYTFHLRKGVKFSDGSEFNADAVKMNFDAVLGNRERHSWLGLIDEIKDTQVIDESTFKVVFKNAYYPALQEFGLIRPLRFLAPSGFPDDKNTAVSIKKPIGTGPWVLSEYKKDEYAVFVRNEHYWGSKPKIDKIIVKIIPDGEARTLAFEKGDLDLIYGSGLISIDAFNELKNSGKYETKLSDPVSSRVVVINSDNGATKDLNVRLAVEYGLNKQSIVDGVFAGTEEKADTLFAPNFPYCDLKLKPYEYDIKKAKSLLDEAGWKVVKGKEFREKEGQPLEIALYFDMNDTTQKGIAQIMQGDLRNLGINLKIVGEEEQSYLERQKTGEFNLIFNETWGAPYDPHSFVSSMRTNAHADYMAQQGLSMKQEIDKKIGEVLISTDETKRQEMYRYILETLHEQAIYIPISYTKNMTVYNKKVKNVDFLPSAYEIPFENMNIE